MCFGVSHLFDVCLQELESVSDPMGQPGYGSGRRWWGLEWQGQKGTIPENNMWTAAAGGLLSSVTPLAYSTSQPHAPLRPAQELPEAQS